MVQKFSLSITAVVPTSTNFSTQTSEFTSTRCYCTEPSSGREDILASLLGVSVIINLGLIAITVMITMCKLIYFKVNLSF